MDLASCVHVLHTSSEITRMSRSFMVIPGHSYDISVVGRGSTLVPFNPFWRPLRLCSRCCGDGEPSYSWKMLEPSNYPKPIYSQVEVQVRVVLGLLIN